jgi:CTP-dependent riboflavin kinase
MALLKGTVIQGCRHFTQSMTKFPEVFSRATGEALFPGTLNVDVGRPISIQEEFRIPGRDINEPGQDLLFERCAINGIPAYRIRPFVLATGQGGHGDHILEIVCATRIPNVTSGSLVEITLFRQL